MMDFKHTGVQTEIAGRGISQYILYDVQSVWP